MMNKLGIRCHWKPMLWYVKGTRVDVSNVVSDVVTGDREKQYHDWQQSESEAGYWIDKLCPKDGLVVDPFFGGGTTGVAATRLNRRWVGFEIDEQQADIAVGRLNESG